MSNEPSNYLDPMSLLVIILTLVLFVIALFVKGFSHELLQECGVFLVSVKLIMMSHKNGVSTQRVLIGTGFLANGSVLISLPGSFAPFAESLCELCGFAFFPFRWLGDQKS